MSCDETPVLEPISMYRGSDRSFSSTLRSGSFDNELNVFVPGEPISLEGATVTWLTVDQDGAVFFQKVAVIDPDQSTNTGKFKINITHVDSVDFPIIQSAKSEYKIVESTGDISFYKGPLFTVNETLDPTD